MAPRSPDKDAETVVFIQEMAKFLPTSLEKFKIPLLWFMDLGITLGFSSKIWFRGQIPAKSQGFTWELNMTISLLLEMTIFKAQLLQNVLLTHFGVPLNNLWVMTWILKNDSLSLEGKKKKANHKCKSILHYWANLLLMLVKRGLLWMYVCLQVPPKKQKEKKKKNPEAPHRPHTLAVLSCKEPQLPSPALPPPPTTLQHYTCKPKPKAFPRLLWLGSIMKNKAGRQHLLFIRMIEMMNKFS